MTNISRDIFKSIHEGRWLYVEYENKSNERTKYWISIQNINVDQKSLECVGLHLGIFSTKKLFLFIDKILFTQVMDGTFYKTNQNLIDDIELFPKKYEFLFKNSANLKTLNYLSDCNNLADLPKLNEKYELVKKLDSSKIVNRIYNLDDEQFKAFIASFKKRAEIRDSKKNDNIIQIALNVLSIYTPKGLYVLAYREVRLDVEKKILIAGSKIKICSEFSVKNQEMETGTKLSIQNFLDNDELYLIEDFETNSELIKDTITKNIENKNGFAVDDRPYFLCIQRNININLENEYKAIVKMYSENEVTTPIKAFFGELQSVKANEEILPIALVDKNVNLDQLLSIYNALNYPVAYIQGPPGTGKTSTIINTIISAFFNSKTVLFSSYNNHPIDGVFEKLTNLKYKNYNIPFPILRIGNNERIFETCEYIKNLLQIVKNLNVFDDVLFQNKISQIEKTKKLTELLQKHEEKIDLKEREDLLESMLSKNENIALRMNLEGQQLTLIQNRLKEIGDFTDEDALNLLDFDYDKFLQFLNFTSVKFLKQLFNEEYKDFLQILNIKEREKQASEFNKFFSDCENVRKMQKVFPIFCSTCISSQKIGTPEIYFDMTIIDEASQCNSAVSLVPILRGKSLMLVGDPQQLNPVITLDKNINEELKAKYNVSDSYDYIENSIYKVFLANDSVSQETLLHNHYRCNKKIIDFNNKKYYNNQLNIKSKSEDENPLVFCEIRDNFSTEKNTAPNEVEEIVDYIQKNQNKKIGIITPFRNQKELIEKKLKEKNLEKIANCGTVHAFQGDEKDEILFSLALTNKTGQKTYNWLKNNRELINVAVSRAKEKIIVLSSEKELNRLHKENEQDDLFEFSKYVQQNGNYQVTSRENSSRALGIKPYSSETEETFLETLNHALTNLLMDDSKLSVKREVQLSHIFENLSNESEYFFRASLDFVIYKRICRKEFPVLAIELNGKEHYNDKKVIARDEKKKQICKERGFTLISVENSYARRYDFIKDILTEFFGKK